ncbi:CAP domain-containing protein [Synechocystis sp. FACHB-383]|uniref:CAP domain-containing protein n=1 Tax=Synechocystis sp. FACHB-383 TaxID=2692864 RepID=UPI001F554071|nr:CAP domain-containing protein [Synechocystis sp. FACHB-383]
MGRYRYRSPKSKKITTGIIVVVAMILFQGKDSLYYHNGNGGDNWKIGSPQTHIFNAHQTRSLPDLQTQALSLVNRDRQLNNLPPLVADPLITKTAQGHAEDMAKRNFYGHDTPEGKSPTDRYQALGGKGGVGENIVVLPGSPHFSLNYGLVERFQKSWMYSEGHRKNLLTPNYTKFGYGIATNPRTAKVYAVQNFQ